MSDSVTIYIKKEYLEYNNCKDDINNFINFIFPEKIGFRVGVAIGSTFVEEAYMLILHTWDQIKPFCEFISMTISTSIFFLKVIAYLKRKHKKKCKDIFTIILSKEEWDINLIQKDLGLNKEQCKKILKLFQYKWDYHKRKYIRTLNVDQVIEMLNINK